MKDDGAKIRHWCCTWDVLSIGLPDKTLYPDTFCSIVFPSFTFIFHLEELFAAKKSDKGWRKILTRLIKTCQVIVMPKKRWCVSLSTSMWTPACNTQNISAWKKRNVAMLHCFYVSRGKTHLSILAFAELAPALFVPHFHRGYGLSPATHADKRG